MSDLGSLALLFADLMHSNPPPRQSRPEAANFPNQTYEMSADRQLFQAPAKYPEPPENMYYDVPKAQPAPERPKPIFPWEINQPKPTRVFADDPPPTPSETAPSVTTDEGTEADTVSPTTPAISVTPQEPLATFSRSNAWDDIPEIDRYIANLPQNRRAKVQVLYNKPQGTVSTDDPSTTAEPSPSQRPDRRGSLKITDFPNEIERPSLPVTPAPIHRPSFWGQERDAAGELPPAEGVPEQSQWDPTERLAELQRRQSEVLEKGPQSPPRAIPNRQLLGSAAPISQEGATTDTAREKAAASSTEPAGLAEEAPQEVQILDPEEAAALPTNPIPVPIAVSTLNFAGGPPNQDATPAQQAEIGPTKL